MIAWLASSTITAGPIFEPMIIHTDRWAVILRNYDRVGCGLV